MKIVIFEGCRGTGKSTLAQSIRHSVESTTLINFTGFKDDDEEGFSKIKQYYIGWINYFKSLQHLDITFICDRFFFSEVVFSKLYKSYGREFEEFYLSYLLPELKILSENNDVLLFHMTIENKQELANRLNRDKIPFANVVESCNESLKQQDEYFNLFENLNVFTIDTDRTQKEIYKKVLWLISREDI